MRTFALAGVACLLVLCAWQRNTIKLREADIVALEIQNIGLEESVGALEEDKKQAGIALLQRDQDYVHIELQREEKRTAQEELKADANYSTWADTPLPISVVRLLNENNHAGADN